MIIMESESGQRLWKKSLMSLENTSKKLKIET